MGSTSSIARHRQREAIETALDAGTPYREVSAKYGVSLGALSRFQTFRRGTLAAIASNEPNLAGVVQRLASLADDAEHMRQSARIAGNPSAFARSIKTELEVLDRLITKLGLDDLGIARFAAEVSGLTEALRDTATDHPEAIAPLIRRLRLDPDLQHLADALTRGE